MISPTSPRPSLSAGENLSILPGQGLSIGEDESIQFKGGGCHFFRWLLCLGLSARADCLTVLCGKCFSLGEVYPLHQHGWFSTLGWGMLVPLPLPSCSDVVISPLVRSALWPLPALISFWGTSFGFSLSCWILEGIPALVEQSSWFDLDCQCLSAALLHSSRNLQDCLLRAFLSISSAPWAIPLFLAQWLLNTKLHLRAGVKHDSLLWSSLLSNSWPPWLGLNLLLQGSGTNYADEELARKFE